jgi:hypothetical protein
VLDGQESTRDANSPFDLAILTEEVARGVGEPVRIGQSGLRQVDDSGGHGGIALGQAFLAPKEGGVLFITVETPSTF